jgi:hypothetical protein
MYLLKEVCTAERVVLNCAGRNSSLLLALVIEVSSP